MHIIARILLPSHKTSNFMLLSDLAATDLEITRAPNKFRTSLGVVSYGPLEHDATRPLSRFDGLEGRDNFG